MTASRYQSSGPTGRTTVLARAPRCPLLTGARSIRATGATIVPAGSTSERFSARSWAGPHGADVHRRDGRIEVDVVPSAVPAEGGVRQLVDEVVVGVVGEPERREVDVHEPALALVGVEVGDDEDRVANARRVGLRVHEERRVLGVVEAQRAQV